MEEQEKIDIREHLIGWIDTFLKDGIVPKVVNPKAIRANYVPKSKIKELKKENEKKIDAMRPYKHQCPFDFGVLNGIDECCRKLLEDEDGKDKM